MRTAPPDPMPARRTSARDLARLLLILLGAVAAARPGPARADEREALVLDLEVVELSGGAPAEALQASLALAGEHGCATAESRRGSLGYEIEVCRVGGEARAPVVALRLKRSSAADRYSGVKQVRVENRVALGRKLTLCRLAHSDGAATEVRATVRAAGG